MTYASPPVCQPASMVLAPMTVRVDNVQVIRMASLALHAIERRRTAALDDAVLAEIAARERWNRKWWVVGLLRRETHATHVLADLRGYDEASNKLREFAEIGAAAERMAIGLAELAVQNDTSGALFIARREWDVMLPWSLADPGPVDQ